MIAFYICKFSMFINSMTAAVIMLICLNGRYKKWQTLLWYALLTILLIELKVRMQLVWPWQYFSCILTFCSLVYMRIFYINHWSQLVLLWVLYLLPCAIGESVAGYLCTIFWPDSPTIFDWYSFEMVRMSGIAQVCMLIQATLAVIWWKKYLFKMDSAFVAILAFIALQLCFTFYMPPSVGDLGKDKANIFFPNAFYIVDTMLFYLFYQQEKRIKVAHNLRELEYLQKIEEIHYQSIVDRRKELENLQQYFDMNLNRVKQLLQQKNTAEAQLLLNEMHHLLESTREAVYCNHPVVNAVLYQKELICKKEHISLAVHVAIEDNISIQSIHLCNLFTNLLDNAITANVEKINGDKWIELAAMQEQEYLYVIVKNPAEKIEKRKRIGHGFGKQIIQDVTTLYDGDYQVNWDEQEKIYTAQIALKLN